MHNITILGELKTVEYTDKENFCFEGWHVVSLGNHMSKKNFFTDDGQVPLSQFKIHMTDIIPMQKSNSCTT